MQAIRILAQVVQLVEIEPVVHILPLTGLNEALAVVQLHAVELAVHRIRPGSGALVAQERHQARAAGSRHGRARQLSKGRREIGQGYELVDLPPRMHYAPWPAGHERNVVALVKRCHALHEQAVRAGIVAVV